MTADHLARLAAGLDADERIARAATKLPQPIVRYPEKRPPWEPEAWEIDKFGDLVSVNGGASPVHDEGGVRDADTAAHMANWDPKRALKVVDALRTLVSMRDRADRKADESSAKIAAVAGNGPINPRLLQQSSTDNGEAKGYEIALQVLADIYEEEEES